MINLKRMKQYRQIWIQLNKRFSVEQIGETIELIEETKLYPNKEEASYEIWQTWENLR